MKKNLVTVIIILAIIIFSVYALTKDNGNVDEELAKCIGQNSILYMRTGCSACKAQEDLFGDSVKHLEIIDCLIQGEKCAVDGIISIPTWIIHGEKYVGVQSIDKLKNLTGC